MSPTVTASRISIRATTVVFGLVFLLILGITLHAIIKERHEEFVAYHQSLSNNASQSVAKEIERALRLKRQLVETFLEDNINLVQTLVEHPEDEQMYEQLNSKLSRYFNDFFATNIITPDGQLVVDDFDGDIGDYCLRDMKDYVNSGIQLIRIHPNPKIYHYDVLVNFQVNGQSHIFIVTFGTLDIYHLLDAATPHSHELLVIDKLKNLIEITKQGSRDTLASRDDNHLNEEEKQNILSSSTIRGSYWQVVDIVDHALFKNHRYQLYKQTGLIFAFFVILMLLTGAVILVSVGSRNRLETYLREKNDEITQLNNNLEELSLTDSLTGLYNRRYLDLKSPVEMALARSMKLPINIALVDIDHFKNFNDTLGHLVGDECLRQVATILKTNFRRANEILARYGGEEFIIINIGNEATHFKDNLIRLATQVREHEFIIDDKHLDEKITISIGVSSISGNGLFELTQEEILAQADAALYKAKQQGRDRIVTYDSITPAAVNALDERRDR